MATIKRFEDIQAWQKAKVLVREIYKLSRAGLLRNDFELRRQMCGAAVSSMSNIAEGFGRKTSRDFAHFLDVARGRSPRSSLCFTLLSTLDIFRPSILKSCSVWLKRLPR